MKLYLKNIFLASVLFFSASSSFGVETRITTETFDLLINCSDGNMITVINAWVSKVRTDDYGARFYSLRHEKWHSPYSGH